MTVREAIEYLEQCPQNDILMVDIGDDKEEVGMMMFLLVEER